ncbi:hypothetical protein [Streptomyces sp. SAS_272]|uniref:hypothetical protein n=1 Tax=Streptomyces sp. SAS_272 TaxID=3412747 RepID=UPI00403CBD36
MSQPNDRVRTHIKALMEEMKHQATSGSPHVQAFLSGMLSGLAASVEILDGGTAEASLERMVQRLSSAIGEAYLAGNLPPRPPAQEDEDARRAGRRSNIRERLEQLGRRGILGTSAAELLRNQVEAEMREADTARAVAASNLRHVKTLVPELEAAQSAIERVRALAADMHTWCSPHGIATDYAKRIEMALDAPVTTAVTSVNADLGGSKAADHVGHGSPCEEQPDRACAGIDPAQQLRDQIAAALYERERPPRDPAWPDAYAADREVFGDMADAVLAVVLPATSFLGELHPAALVADVNRVIDLYERWCKAGPPPLGTSISRWWDKRLLELRHAVLGEPNGDPS